MKENIRLSFRGVLAHKMRSFLTMLGIIIGIAAIIAIVSTIRGTNEQIQKNLIGTGDNSVNVVLSQGDYDYDFSGGVPDGVPVLGEETAAKLAEIDHAEGVSFYRKRQDYEGVWHLTSSLTGGYIYGVDSNYFETAGLTVQKGRLISAHDISSYLKVCVLDANSASSLFPGEDPLGKTIEIRKEPFTVIGVVTEKEAFEPVITSIEDYYMYSQNLSGAVYVPGTLWDLLYQYDEPQNVLIRADSTQSMTRIGKDAEAVLNASLASTDTYAYKAKDLLEQAKEIQQLSASTNMMLIWIAGISLLVGGIGVMNIMLVSVTERTSEIGLKKAIGAPKKSILIQFLTEAVVLTSIGGVLGVIAGVILAYAISQINGTPVAISWPAAAFAVLFSMVIGIVFGFLPSWKAANLDPIEALRHE